MIGWLGALVAEQSSQGLLLWQNVRAGMTVEQLRAVEPNTVAIASDQKAHFLPGCGYTSGTITVVSEVMDVCYKMKDDKVEAVLLHGSKLDTSPLTGSLLKTALASKYGPAISDSCSPMPVGQLCKAVWKHDGVTIIETSSVVMDQHSVSVTYEIGSSDADQL